MKCVAFVLIVTLLLFGNSASGTEIEPGDPEDIGPDAPQISLPPDEDASFASLPNDTQKELSLDVRIRQMLEHFKQDDPRGIPGLPIPDPMPIPDFKGNFPGADIKFSDANLYDLSKFRIDYVRTDLKDLRVWVGLTFDTLEVIGQYRMGSWFSTSSGDFNVTLIKVQGEGFAEMVVDSEGSLQASNITFDIKFKDINMKFDNLGFFGTVFQGIINSVGTFVFDSIKPMILEQVNDKIQQTLNTQMRELEQYLPDSIPPLDLAIAVARTQIQDMEMDPFHLPEMNFTLQSGMGLRLLNGTLYGLSTLHRSGDVVFSYENGSLIVGAQAATQKLSGKFNWQLDFKLYSPRGQFRLEIEHLDVKIGLTQPINVSKKPRLEVLKVSLGNIQARSRGTGSLDYLIEFSINFVLNGFRSVMLRTMEKPVTHIIQQQLDKLDIEGMINEQLNNLNGVSKEATMDGA